jgi:hypothetical protein
MNKPAPLSFYPGITAKNAPILATLTRPDQDQTKGEYPLPPQGGDAPAQSASAVRVVGEPASEETAPQTRMNAVPLSTAQTQANPCNSQVLPVAMLPPVWTPNSPLSQARSDGYAVDTPHVDAKGVICVRFLSGIFPLRLRHTRLKRK